MADAIVRSTHSIEQLLSLEKTMAALSLVALSRQISLSTEGLMMMAQDLQDVPWLWLNQAIEGWRRGILPMGRPSEMDKFPTVRQLRLQAELLRLEQE